MRVSNTELTREAPNGIKKRVYLPAEIWRVRRVSADLLGAARSRIIGVMGSQWREWCRKKTVTKPGLPNNGIASFSGGSAFERHGRQ